MNNLIMNDKNGMPIVSIEPDGAFGIDIVVAQNRKTEIYQLLTLTSADDKGYVVQEFFPDYKEAYLRMTTSLLQNINLGLSRFEDGYDVFKHFDENAEYGSLNLSAPEDEDAGSTLKRIAKAVLSRMKALEKIEDAAVANAEYDRFVPSLEFDDEDDYQLYVSNRHAVYRRKEDVGSFAFRWEIKRITINTLP